MASRAGLKIALLSDTHGQLDARIAARVADCAWAVHAGDIGHADILKQLRPRQGKVLAVRGNNDVPAKWPRQQHALLARLPEQLLLPLPGGHLAVVHGHRAGPVANRHARLRAQFPDARAVLYGHSHRLVCDQDDAVWVLNPGAAGRARTYGGPSCMILHVSNKAWQIEIVRFQA